MNLYRFRGRVWEFLRPLVAYFALPCSSGIEVVLEFVAATRGSDVVPVLWHCSTTSLKTTNHISFLLLEPRTSLSLLNDDFPRTPLRVIAGGGEEDLRFEGALEVGHCRSSTSTREGFGSASWRTLSRPSIRAKISRVLSRSSFWIFSSSILLTMVSTSATICRVLSYSNVLGSVWNRRFWKRRGYFRRRWKGFESVMARPVSPLSLAFSSSLCRALQTFCHSAAS